MLTDYIFSGKNQGTPISNFIMKNDLMLTYNTSCVLLQGFLETHNLNDGFMGFWHIPL